MGMDLLFDVYAGRHLSTCFNNLRNIMFTDHELLKLAALAAGLEPDKAEWTQRAGLVWIQHVDGIRKEFRWNPLTDDGDALRLEVVLKATVAWDPMRDGWSVGAIVNCEFKWLAFHEDRNRASVLAAGEIGRQMKKDNIS